LAADLQEDLEKNRSVLILGPRQTGKSTLIKETLANFPDSLQYPLQLPSVRTALETDPELVRREVDGLKRNRPPVVFIDEVQKVPALLDVLQYLLDENKIVLVASGSSARKMRHGVRNWLPGRIRLKRLHPLTWRESGLLDSTPPTPARLEERLLFGGLPGILREPDEKIRGETLQSYAALYLEEEIRQEAVVRRLAPFSRFLKLAALESGGSPNLSRMASDVGVSHTTLAGYYQILEDSLVVHRVPAFGRSRADVLRRPRFYFFDLGVRNAAAGVGHGPAVLTLQAGLLFEHLILLETIVRLPEGSISYWRTKTGEEVDFIVELGSRVLALEVKWTQRPVENDLAGLAAFQSRARCDGAFLLCRVARDQKFKSGTAVPWWRLPDLLRTP
jgi:predicted AAA+ superfamily ATPase